MTNAHRKNERILGIEPEPTERTDRLRERREYTDADIKSAVDDAKLHARRDGDEQ